MNRNSFNEFRKSLKPQHIIGLVGLSALYFVSEFVYTVNVGHRALKFNILSGLQPKIYREGWNFKLPFIERPIIFNIQSQEKSIPAETANREMQTVKLMVKLLYHPEENQFHNIYTQLGPDYDEKVLPAIVNEITRAVVAQYSATQLLSQRDQVSDKIRSTLAERASNFWIKIDSVAITDLTFGREYLETIEGKQVAQQEAQRAKYEVEQAREARKSIVIKAEAQARSIELVGGAAMTNPSYLEVRRIEYSKEIAQILSDSKNHILLNSGILQMDSNFRYGKEDTKMQ